MRTLILRVVLVVAVAVLAGAAASAFSASQPRTFTASMRFEFGRLVSPELQLLGSNFAEPQVDAAIRIATEADEVNSLDVAQATARAAPNLGNANVIAAATDAVAVRGTLNVLLTAQAATPQLAAQMAATYGQQYLAVRRARERARGETVEAALRTQLRALPGKQQFGLQASSIRNQIGAIRVLRRVGTGEPQIIDSARASFAQTSPNTTRNVLFGVIFGLVVGIGMVALRSETSKKRPGAGARPAAPSAHDETLRPR